MKHSDPRAPIAEDWQKGDFGLYIHWPFCQSKCPYCDFNSHVQQTVDQGTWLSAYQSEIKRVGLLTQGRSLQSVFFGGGTPSLMQPGLVEGILKEVSSTWRLSNACEITLEANPSSVEAGRFQDYRNAGVNRISMGIQALNDNDLRRLGRLHTAAEARRAFDIAREIFDRVSFDLIYARQNQTVAQWESELSLALSMSVDHLSLYQLTVENGTVFGDRFARGMLTGLPDENRAADLYILTQDLCSAAGMPAYEISNHARSGAESRHNMIYWNAGDYAGIGPGAHGRLTHSGQRWATEATKHPADWLEKVAHGNPDITCNSLSTHEQGIEYLLMGLRTTNGIDLKRFSALAGKDFDKQALEYLTDLKLIIVSNDVLRATEEGRLLLNRVIEKLAC